MGAEQFTTRAKGKTAQEAFATATHEAAWERGHGGYTGTIAEKHSFVEITVPKGVPPLAFINAVQRYPHDRSTELATAELQNALKKAYDQTDDKWGPAGAVQVGPEEWLFFGWASS